MMAARSRGEEATCQGRMESAYKISRLCNHVWRACLQSGTPDPARLLLRSKQISLLRKISFGIFAVQNKDVFRLVLSDTQK
jgi:hypothetical protein